MIKLSLKNISRLSGILLLSVLIQGCGFSPVHKTGTGFKSESYSNVKIVTLNEANPDDKEVGFHIKQNMIDRIGQGNGPHTLQISPSLRQRRLGITGDDIASRFEINLRARYSIIEDKTGEVLDSGTLTSISSFGSPIDPYGRISAEENAAERLAADIADDLVLKLSKFYADQDS